MYSKEKLHVYGNTGIKQSWKPVNNKQTNKSKTVTNCTKKKTITAKATTVKQR